MEVYLHSANTPSWHGAQLKHEDNFTLLYFTISKHGTGSVNTAKNKNSNPLHQS